MNLLHILTLLVIFAQQCFAYRILAIIPFSGKSHYILTQSIVKELAVRGHHVTVITVFSEKNPPANYEEIIVEQKLFWDFMGQEPDIYALEQVPLEGMLNLVWDAVQFTTETAFNSTNLQDFIDNDNSHYDLIFAEVFYQESMYMFSHKYKAPIIGISTMGFTQSIGEAQGNPLVVSYMTHEFLNFGKKLSFCERVKNLYSTTYDLFWRHFYLFPMHQKMAEKYFKKLPGPLPQLEDIEKNNVSLVFINTHFSYDLVRPYVPRIVEIGGVHIKPPKKLPENLQKFLDDAKDGAIYFSFGTNVKSKDMPKEKVKIFLNVFKKLKQRVIWKWEDDDFADKPANLLIGTWLPQNDILAHPNVKLFITHGGLLSTQETIYHGVPVVGFPFYGDQFLNMQKVEEVGYGIKMSFAKLTEATFEKTLNEVLNNPKYLNKVTELSERFKDRPNSAMDTAIYWIEFVIRHKGAPFMRSPILDMNWIEFHVIDIAALIVVTVVLVLLFMCFLIKITCNVLKPRSPKNNKLNAKKRQ